MQNSVADFRNALGDRALVNVPLAPRTTFRIGGPADFLAEAHAISQFIELVLVAHRFNVPVFILGNGSNLLVRDGGIAGLVIENHCDQFFLEVTKNGHAKLHVESGAALPNIANRMARQGWSGLEWGIGVPGTIGGAIVGNAGAHGSSIADNILTVSILDEKDSVRELPKNELGFDYRTSRFKQTKNEIVLSADFEIVRSDPQVCIARMNEYTEKRRSTQPTEASVGSMFKNPPNNFAGRLIEQAGLKGTRIGNIEVSQVHANFFVNRGGAAANDVMQLIDLVRARVREKFGIELELEIEIVGK